MRLIIPIVFAVLIAVPALAQGLDPRYQSIGEIRVTIGGNPYDMVVPFDTEQRKSFASEREIIGRRTFNIFGSVVGEDGRPANPSLQITFFVKDGKPDLVAMEVFDEEGWRKPLSINAEIGSGDFTDFRITADNRITASFAGEMLRLDNSDTRKPTVAQGAKPVSIEGAFSVAVPPAGS